MMNLSTFTPLKNAIPPFPQLDGSPRRWRGRRERSVRLGEEAVYAGFALLLSERRAVVSSRGASIRLWGRVDSSRGKIGGVTSITQRTLAVSPLHLTSP